MRKFEWVQVTSLNLIIKCLNHHCSIPIGKTHPLLFFLFIVYFLRKGQRIFFIVWIKFELLWNWRGAMASLLIWGCSVFDLYIFCNHSTCFKWYLLRFHLLEDLYEDINFSIKAISTWNYKLYHDYNHLQNYNFFECNIL